MAVISIPVEIVCARCRRVLDMHQPYAQEVTVQPCQTCLEEAGKHVSELSLRRVVLGSDEYRSLSEPLKAMLLKFVEDPERLSLAEREWARAYLPRLGPKVREYLEFSAFQEQMADRG